MRGGSRKGSIRIGISGWTYRGWRGAFYPKGLPHKRELEYAARQFNAIEINGTHYGLQRPESFGQWRDATPDDFVFAVKGSRYITHMLKLRNVETPLANFLASGVLRLGPKLGPILWQFPARMPFEHDQFDAFLRLLPRDTRGAVAVARRHDARLDGRDWVECDVDQPLRHALEIRHESFRSAEFIRLLRRHRAAQVCADTLAWPRLMDVTADFDYCRLHGSEELYVSGYDDAALDVWAERVRRWAAGGEPADAERVLGAALARKSGRDVFVFFDNDAKVRAPFDAMALQKRVSELIENA